MRVLVFLLLMLVPTLASAYKGSGSIWAQAKGDFIPKNFPGDSTGFGQARDYCLADSGGVIQLGPGMENTILTYPLGKGLLILKSFTTGWNAVPSPNAIISRLGPASTPTTGGAIRIVDGVVFPFTAIGIQAAINDLPNKGGTVILPADSVHVGTSTLSINKPNVTLQGAGGRATVLEYSGTGRFIQISTDDGLHTGADAYTGGVSGVTIKGIRLLGPGRASTATCITDWEGGSNEFIDLDIQNWGTGYFGIGADVNTFRTCYFQACYIGTHLGSRSDQTVFDNDYWAGCVFGLRVEYAYGVRVIAGQFVFSDSADILCDAPAVATGNGDIRTEIGLQVLGTWFEADVATLGWKLDRHIWFGKDGTSSRRLDGLSVNGAYVIASSTHFLQIDGGSKVSVFGVNQIGVLDNAPVNVTAVTSVFPTVTLYANYWNNNTIFDGAGSTNTLESLDRIRSTNSVAYATPLTINGSNSGEIVQIGALTGNITINAPTTPTKGRHLLFVFTQDGVGGHTVTWNAVFKHNWSNTGNTAGKVSTIRFYYNGANWLQVGAQSPYF